MYVYIFEGSCPLTEFCHVQYSVCVQVSRSHILAGLLHGSQAAGVGQTLRRDTKNGINGTFAEGATYIQLGGHDEAHILIVTGF